VRPADQVAATAAPPEAPPHRVRVATNAHRWDLIAFLHWPVAADLLARLVPAPLRLLTWGGTAWLGITPFRIRVRPPGAHRTPPGATFPETNVRTYVAGPDGREGLWFLHMEVTRRWFVGALRTLGLPYVRRRMAMAVSDDRIAYLSEAGASGGGGHRLVVEPGPVLDPAPGEGLTRFLTARWDAYHRRGPVLLRTPVVHEPWTLHHARTPVCEVDGLFSALALPVPGTPPLAHWSPGVSVRVGIPRPAGTVAPG
jgi:uncharacterized protein